jgi:VWFA-related protein
MIRRFVRGLVIVAGAWAAVTTSAQTPPPQTPPPTPPAQTADPQQQPTFRTRIDTVQVDVTVLDKQGKAILDLKEGDFEIRENKAVQPVQTFKLIQIDDVSDSTPVRDILNDRDQQRELARDDSRLIVIFLDDYHTRKINSMRIRLQLAEFVDGLANNDLVAVMTPLLPATSLGFSYNHAATARTVMGFDGRKYDYTPRNNEEARWMQLPPEVIEQYRNRNVIVALESVCAYLGTVREGRKMVLYVSEGMNSTVPMGLSVGGGLSGMSSQSLAMDLQTQLTRVFQAAARSNTSISTLDPRGLSTNETMAADPRAADVDRLLIQEGTDQLRTLANETDGRAIVSSNEPLPQLRRMMRDLSAYYLLSYRAASPHDGKFHEIQVKVNRKDVDVHARKGYWAYTEEEFSKASAPAKPPAAADLTEALSKLAGSGDRATGRLVRTWLGAARGEGDKAIVTFVWEPSGPAGDPADTVATVSITANSISGAQLFTGKVPLDPQAAKPTGRVTFDAPPGGVRVRVVPENARGTRLDAQDDQVDVPNFGAGKPVITVPVIYRGRTVLDIRQLKNTPTALPSVSREFSRTERLLLRFQASGPSGPPTSISMSVLNQQGALMAPMPAPVATANGYDAEVVLGAFPAGTYVIEITGDFGGQKIRTLLAIRVTGG